MTDDGVQYAFAIICIVQALIAIGLSFAASTFADLAIPEEQFVDNELTYQTLNREGLEYVDRRISGLNLRWANTFGQALLFMSLISGLVINFPWLYLAGIVVWIVTLIAALYFARGPIMGIRRLVVYRKRLEGRVRRGFLAMRMVVQPEVAFVLGMDATQWKSFEAKILAVENQQAANEQAPIETAREPEPPA